MALSSSHQRSLKIPTSVISLDDLERLFLALIQINYNAKRYQMQVDGLAVAAPASVEKPKEDTAALSGTAGKTSSSGTTVQPSGDPVDDFFMPFRIEIETDSGDKLAFLTRDAFDKKQVPKNLRAIRIDNSHYYYGRVGRFPECRFLIVLDLKTPPAFDFSIQSNPSEPTNNESNILFIGPDEIWVKGGYEIVRDILVKPNRRHITAPVHLRYTYDLLLWIVTLPFAIWNLWKFDIGLVSVHPQAPVPVRTIGYLFATFFCLVIQKIGFNYARWLFPYFEIAEFPRPSQRLQRTIFGFVVLTIFGALITGAGSKLLKWAFGINL